MTERKPRTEKWESFAERQIREAQERGEFDRLPGLGQPIPDLDQEDDDWWLKQKLRQEGLVVLPPILEARLRIEKTLEAIRSIASEHEVRRRLTALNEFIRQAHFSTIAGPPDGVLPVDIEATIAKWKQNRHRIGESAEVG